MKIVNIQLCVSDSFAGLHQLLDGAADHKIIYAWEIVGDTPANPANPATATAKDAAETATPVTEALRQKRKWTRRIKTGIAANPDHAAKQSSGTTTSRVTDDEGSRLEIRK